MGAGCSNEKSTSAEQAPAVQKVTPVPSVKQEIEETPADPPPPRFVLASTAGGPDAEAKDLEDATEDMVEEEKRDPVARLEALTKCFQALDKDKSGNIDSRELKQYLFKTGVNVGHITGKAEELMRKMDLNEDELVSLEEFTQMMEALLVDKSDGDLEVWVAEVVYTATSRNVVGFGNSLGEVLSNLNFNPGQVDSIKKVFAALDRDKSRFVELHEVKVLFGKSGLELETASEEVMAIMAKLDKNGDNKISEQEFFVTLSAVRKTLGSDDKFTELLDNVWIVAQEPEAAAEKPALTDMLLAEDL